MTTTLTAQIDGKAVNQSPNNNLARVQELTDYTKWALDFFPDIASLSNVHMYCRSVWMYESSFRQFGNAGNSRGNNIISAVIPPPEDLLSWRSGRDFYHKYWVDPVIADYRKKNGSTEGILDGLYAQGIAQVVGAYHVRGCKAAKEIFQSTKYMGITESNGLMVNPGQRVIDVYPDTVLGRKRSVLAGTIIINYWFNYWNKQSMTENTGRLIKSSTGITAFPTNKIVDADQALILSMGSYVGFKGRDANGSTGVQRAFNIYTNRAWPDISSGSGSGSVGGANGAKAIGCT
jgi:hypothetical protein